MLIRPWLGGTDLAGSRISLRSKWSTKDRADTLNIKKREGRRKEKKESMHDPPVALERVALMMQPRDLAELWDEDEVPRAATDTCRHGFLGCRFHTTIDRTGYTLFSLSSSSSSKD